MIKLMISIKYTKKIGRIKFKYQKYRYKHNKIYSLILILLYILRNFINIIFLKINSVFSRKNINGRKILFIESPQQGYGDLLFQTPIFPTLNKNGYIIDVLIKDKHEAILKNNPHISNILFWNSKGILKGITSEYNFVIGLGRDAVKTNVILFSKIFSKKIIPDLDLDLWHKSFNNLNPSRVWQKLILSNFNLISNFDEMPRIYFSSEENKKIQVIKNNYKRPIILIISSVDDKLKQYPHWNDVIEKLNNNSCVTLIKNKDKMMISQKNIQYILTKSYRDAIYYIAASDIIVGTEGSLIHIASALNKNLIVLEASDSFEKQTFLKKSNKFTIIDNHVCKYWYRTDLKKRARICYLDKNGNTRSDYNPCLLNIKPEKIVQEINFMVKNNFKSS